MIQKIKAKIIKKTDLSTKQKLPYIVKICERISKASTYLLVFLLPLFFLPWTVDVLDFNKQALLVVLVFISFFCWLLKFIIIRRSTLNLTLISLPVIILFLVFLFSTIFSSYFYGSFWGWPQIISESLLTLLGFILFYFLLINIFEKKEIFSLTILFVFSCFLAMLYGVFQLFGNFLLPLDFTKSTGFNTIGTVNTLGVFAAVLLPLLTVLFIVVKNTFLKIFFLFSIGLTIILLILIGFQIAWWLVITGSALLIILGVQKREFFDNRLLILPMFSLTCALLFSLFGIRVPGIPSRPLEVPLTQKASLDVSLGALKENPIFGSGPGTFVYNFSKYKDIKFNQSPFWNIRFQGGASKILSLLGTVGILGIISFLTLIGIIIFYGIKSIFAVPKTVLKEEISFLQLGLGIFISFITLTVGYFLHQSNFSLDFLFFFLIAIFVALVLSKKKEVLFRSSSLVTLGVTFAFALIFIFGAGIIILEAQKYVAEASYFQGLRAWQQGNFEETLTDLERAVRLNPKIDLYWRELSQVYLRQIDRTVKKTDLSQEEITRQVQLLINAAINSAKTATNLNPENVANFSVQGFIYQNLIGIVEGTTEWAIKSYEQALLLEPTNPYFPTQLGLIYYQNNDYQKAQAELERAVLLNQNYANALYFLGLTYDQLGDKDKAIEKFKKVSDLNPDNAEVKNILENLKAGEKALTGITEEVSPQVPIEEEHPEIKE